MSGVDCPRCQGLFSGFQFEDWEAAEPPWTFGIYAVRISHRERPIAEILQATESFIQSFSWPQLRNALSGYLKRVKRISDCDVVYVGRGGGFKKDGTPNNSSIGERHYQLTWSHQVGGAVAILDYFGWKCQFGWREHADPPAEEKHLSNDYKRIHGDIAAFMSS
jgi:hypothetical protein